MRTWVILLLVIVCISVCNAGRTKIQTGVIKDSEEDIDERPVVKTKTALTKKKARQEQEYDDDEEPPHPRTKTVKKTQKKQEQEEDEETGPYTVCGKAPAGEVSACICEDHEVKCDSIIFEDESELNTLDLAVANKDFVAFYFDGQENDIRALKKGLVLKSMEKTLQRLDLAGNSIGVIDAGVFEGFKNLSILNLSHNRLRSLKPSMFNGAPEEKLHQLKLNHNLFAKLGDGVFSKLKNLKRLELDGNRLALTKETFKGLENLEILSLDDCKLDDELPINVFDYLPNLKELSLRRNSFTEVPRAINALNKLEQLDLSGTHISELHEKSLKDDHNVQLILMMDMPYLWHVDDCAFCGLTKLKEVDLSNSSHLYRVHDNAFGHFTGDSGKVKTLTKFNLENCNISTLSEVVYDWTNDVKLQVGGNKINCTCQTAWMVESTYYAFDQSNLNPKCAYPEKVRGKTLSTVKQSDICSDISDKRKGSRLLQSLFLLLGMCLISVLVYHLVTSGKLAAIIRKKPLPHMAYSNLSTDDQQVLEADFQPRPQQV